MKHILSFLLWLPLFANAQKDDIGVERIMERVARLSAEFPRDIKEAWQQFGVKEPSIFDTLQQVILREYTVLADKAEKRSLVLNGYVGYKNPDNVIFMAHADADLNKFLVKQQDRLDALSRAYGQSVKSFFGSKELYNSKGFIVVWDSVYQSRLGALKKFRDGVLKLVKEDIAYLRSRESLFRSKDAELRVQYVEAQLSVLGRLQVLRNNLKRVWVDDGAKQVEYCMLYLPACKN